MTTSDTPSAAPAAPAAPPVTASADARAQDRLRALHRAGQLAERYPEVEALLADLPAERLPQAGQLLSRVDADEVLRHHPRTPVVGVAVTGHGTLAPLVPALTAETARHGMLLRPYVADFGGYVFDLSDPSRPLHAAGADLVLCVLDPMAVLDELPTPWQVADVERTLEEKVRLWDGLVGRFRAESPATLVLNTLPLPRRFTAQLVDHRSRAVLGAAWREANARLLRLAEAHPSLVVLDLDPLIADGGPASETRLSLYAKSHLSAGLLAAYAREIGHLARHLAGRTKKALALDLDGTLWGGVLGEDGPEGIEVGDGYRGEAFQEFQRTVRQLGSQGVLLTAVSKNDLEPVRKVLADHPGMVLREEDFVRVTANWRPKPDNIRETAEVLNLGTDSFVFLDDSPYECGLVRRELPEVATVRLDEEPAEHLERLLRDSWFGVREVTAEDRSRPSRYRDESARGDFLRSFDSLDDYLRELGVHVRLARMERADVGRVAQLTLRTNQFNLTTVRLQPAEVEALADDPDALVLTVRSGDRFGDNGLVGALLLRRDGDVCRVENMLLSCRVFARGIEQTCMATVLRRARKAGFRAVEGRYRETAKNGGVREFYPECGFGRADGGGADAGGGAELAFRHDLADVPAPPDHVSLTLALNGGLL
ncbi:HAD-IIIC family phosphatase [Streptomyces armeniacus]|uniref:HAD-IIIC family phosphatase n=1 Tax=Streptomyces armeniacus TaxID=83291 RepID=A0A345XLA2_9ACTN|nr:HAD-IIIC family phosphatase [Streptomyces armeniacus]AXK32418.1 HAD-IIIC family phosphatase [Streptomyces armeniacus]